MISSPTPQRPSSSTRFWTARRLTFTFIALALLAAVSVSSCTQPENVSTSSPTNANGSSSNGVTVKGPTVSSSKTGAPVNAAAPPATDAPPTAMLTPMPAALLNAPLKTIDGKPFKLSEMTGKVLVLDLWATWCGPCRQEIPHLVELYKEMGPRGVEVIGLDIDPVQDTPADVLAFMKEFKVNYKVAFLDRQYALLLMSDNGSIPQSYVVTRDGKIHSRFIGFSTSQTAPKLRAAIEEALNTKD